MGLSGLKFCSLAAEASGEVVVFDGEHAVKATAVIIRNPESENFMIKQN
jgi:hypothetical protein